MATKKTKKTQPPALSPKQAQVKINSFLKGIDNNNVVIAKKQEQNQALVAQVGALVPVAMTQPQAKVTQSVEKPKASTKDKTTTAKPSKKPAKTAVKPAQDDRPPLKQVITQVVTLAGKLLGAAEIYRATAGYGKWSRQSVYNALEKHFDRQGETYGVRPTQENVTIVRSGDKDEADLFVETVETSEAVASVL